MYEAEHSYALERAVCKSLPWESSLGHPEASKLENSMSESLLRSCQLWDVN